MGYMHEIKEIMTFNPYFDELTWFPYTDWSHWQRWPTAGFRTSGQKPIQLTRVERNPRVIYGCMPKAERLRML